MTLAGKGAWIAGTDRPEIETVRIGFMPLADCAPLVMASVLGFDEQYGVRFELTRELSWTAMRDRLIGQQLDAAHALYGMVYGIQNGIGTQQCDMAVLMNLHQNGQSITLSRALANAARDPRLLRREVDDKGRKLTLAHTFPTGNHAMFLYYWLAAHGIDPLTDCQAVTVPPGQMAASLAAGHMDGFCAGEPWGQRAQRDGAGVQAASSEQVWPNHPGKALGTRAAFAASHPNTCRAMIAALLEAARWLDASRTNREAAAEVLASPAYVNASRETLQFCLAGSHIDEHRGEGCWRGHNGLRFHADGEANFPWLSDGMWFMTQHRRWGLLREAPAYLALAAQVNRIDLYREAAERTGTMLPASPMRSSTLLGGRVWDGSDPQAWARAPARS
ncbi:MULTISPECIES: CmpA/NrtA family ABC transporter substrate-binding protein [Massilia]|jgi:ABC-type nitrate/sulfonate/bicarbonate transport system substrate-binding protein|uniref:CmpA/NrtA family ABC transporter substrate-binding protein n=1 Tax=Massilia TaxID=149698 RepID=UPI001C6335AA|nr:MULTISPECIES: CmpA/NrtA family ABC transporter substrate-binding protein [Massilia]QYG01378.1 ABC transporter substrate-binding protein [Massilia sp. NP310]